MICFHFIIFVLSGTAESSCAAVTVLLWFAFISLSLCYQGQRSFNCDETTQCCDLLSFHYLCAIRDSLSRLSTSLIYVVICFHFIIFVLSGTARLTLKKERKMLWFAFISLSLCYQGQQIKSSSYYILSCDLLSFHYLCAIRDSYSFPEALITSVVICFHFIIFVLSGTAVEGIVLCTCRCDLLSFHYLCAIRDSPSR